MVAEESTFLFDQLENAGDFAAAAGGKIEGLVAIGLQHDLAPGGMVINGMVGMFGKKLIPLG